MSADLNGYDQVSRVNGEPLTRQSNSLKEKLDHVEIPRETFCSSYFDPTLLLSQIFCCFYEKYDLFCYKPQLFLMLARSNQGQATVS